MPNCPMASPTPSMSAAASSPVSNATISRSAPPMSTGSSGSRSATSRFRARLRPSPARPWRRRRNTPSRSRLAHGRAARCRGLHVRSAAGRHAGAAGQALADRRDSRRRFHRWTVRTMTRTFPRYALAFALGFAALAVATASSPGRFCRPAQAVIGRPLTPLSYAGVARRTTRRAYYAGAATGAAVAAGAAVATGAAIAASRYYSYPPRANCYQVVNSYGPGPLSVPLSAGWT